MYDRSHRLHTNGVFVDRIQGLLEGGRITKLDDSKTEILDVDLSIFVRVISNCTWRIGDICPCQ
jgi:hypothetical protein